MQNALVSKLKKDIIFSKNLRGFPFTFHSTWGLFSPKHIDEGTELLIKTVDVEPNDVSLDLGCGYGAIGLTITKLSPRGKVHCVDKDFVAIKYTKKNAQINNINNCEIYLSNGFDKVPPILFNTIVSNIPAKVGKELYFIMMYDAKNRLKKGGKLYFVFISGLKKYFKRSFKDIFGNYTILANSKIYTVISAINT